MDKQLLYKFRDWGNTNHQKILSESQIYFATPLEFNDPFDCKIIPRYDLLNDNQKKMKLEEFLRLDNPNWSNNKIKVKAQRILKEKKYDVEYLSREGEPSIRGVLSSIGIFSLAGNKTNILLWSHYANSHKGFCVGFNKELLLNNIKEEWMKIKIPPIFNRITYQKEYPKIIPTPQINIKDFVEKPLFTKSIVWNYEEEFRVILLKSSSATFIINQNVVEEITLGSEIELDHREEIIALVKNNFAKAKIFQAKKKFGYFELQFDRIG